MNRRKFITTGTMGASLLSIFPSYALTQNSKITLSSLGEGYEVLSSASQSISVIGLSGSVKNTYKRLKEKLDIAGFSYGENTVVKLNENSYLVPIIKKPLLGSEKKQIAFIIKENNKSDFFILNEKQTKDFTSLTNEFNNNMKYHDIDISTSSFSFPSKFVEQTTKDSGNIFVYKNEFNQTIKLYSKKSKPGAYIC